jgi:hypothetical protein
MGSALFLLLLLLVAASPARAGDLVSASYKIRGAHVSAGGTESLSSASFLGLSAAGQSEAAGLSGSAGDLSTSSSGFVPIVAGKPADLDLDGDGVAFFLDDDDDGDGLLDVVETNTGFFAGASDTGTDSLIVDSDGDGLGDGVEVAAGTDPNNPFSPPGSGQVPTLSRVAQGGLVIALLVSAFVFRRRS